MEDKNKAKKSKILANSKKIKKEAVQKPNETKTNKTDIDSIFNTLKEKPKVEKPTEKAEKNKAAAAKSDKKSDKQKTNKSKFTEEGYKIYTEEELKMGRVYKVIELTPDSDSVNITGKICDLQLMESADAWGSAIIVANFNLADETGMVKTQITGWKIKNGDVLKIKNGRIDVVNNKLMLTNDVWTKVTVMDGTSLENANNKVNISEIQYSSKSKQAPIVQTKEEADLK